MASGTILGTTSNQAIEAKIEWSSSGSISTNKSQVLAILYFRKTTRASVATTGTLTGSLTINGTSKSYSTYLTLSCNNTWVELCRNTVDVSHNSDGSKSITISATGGMSGTSFSSTSCSGTATLDTIARASSIDSISCSTAYVDGTITVRYTPKATFSHVVTYKTMKGTTLRTVNLASQSAGQKSTSITFTSAELTKLYEESPSSENAPVKVYLKTMNGSSQVGNEVYDYKTLKIPASVVPNLSFTISETVSKVSDVTSSYVIGLSKPKVKLTGSGVYGSSVTSYSIKINGVTSSSSEYTCVNALDKSKANRALVGSYGFDVVMSVTDSRGRTKSITQAITALDYYAPRVLDLGVFRMGDAYGEEDDSGTSLMVIYDIEIASLGTLNTGTLKMRYRHGSHDWTEVDVTDDFSDSGREAFWNIVSPDYSYSIELVVSDIFNSNTYPFSISTAAESMSFIGQRGVCVGGTAEEDNLFDCKIPALFRKGYMKFSFEPQIVGQWIDGRPVWQRTVYLDMNQYPPGADKRFTTDLVVDTDIECCETVGYMAKNGGHALSYFNQHGNTLQIYCSPSGGGIITGWVDGYTNYIGYVTFQYVKKA